MKHLKINPALIKAGLVFYSVMIVAVALLAQTNLISPTNVYACPGGSSAACVASCQQGCPLSSDPAACVAGCPAACSQLCDGAGNGAGGCSQGPNGSEYCNSNGRRYRCDNGTYTDIGSCSGDSTGGGGTGGNNGGGSSGGGYTGDVPLPGQLIGCTRNGIPGDYYDVFECLRCDLNGAGCTDRQIANDVSLAEAQAMLAATPECGVRQLDCDGPEQSWQSTFNCSGTATMSCNDSGDNGGSTGGGNGGSTGGGDNGGGSTGNPPAVALCNQLCDANNLCDTTANGGNLRCVSADGAMRCRDQRYLDQADCSPDVVNPPVEVGCNEVCGGTSNNVCNPNLNLTCIDVDSGPAANLRCRDPQYPASATCNATQLTPGLDVVKTTVNGNTFLVGSSVQFQVTITNTGQTTLTDVTFADTYNPAYLDFISITGVKTGGSSVNLLGVSSVNEITGQISISNLAAATALGPLAPGQVYTLNFVFVARAPLPMGSNNTCNLAVSTANNGGIQDSGQACVDINSVNTDL